VAEFAEGDENMGQDAEKATDLRSELVRPCVPIRHGACCWDRRTGCQVRL